METSSVCEKDKKRKECRYTTHLVSGILIHIVLSPFFWSFYVESPQFGTMQELDNWINVTSFSSIPYKRNLRLISKTDLVRNVQSIVNQKSMFHLKLPPPPLPCISNQTHITPFPENKPIIQSCTDFLAEHTPRPLVCTLSTSNWLIDTNPQTKRH